MTPDERAKLRAATENAAAGHWRGTDLSLVSPSNVAALLDDADRANQLAAKAQSHAQWMERSRDEWKATANKLQARLDKVEEIASTHLGFPVGRTFDRIILAARGELA